MAGSSMNVYFLADSNLKVPGLRFWQNQYKLIKSLFAAAFALSTLQNRISRIYMTMNDQS